MNYLIAKIGRPMIFNRMKWGAIGGDNEPPQLFLHLANSSPKDRFFIIGRSDFSRLNYKEREMLNPAGNIVDLYDGYSGPQPALLPLKRLTKEFGIKKKKMKGIIYAGPASTSGQVNYNIQSLKEDPKYMCRAMSFSVNYCAPIIFTLTYGDIKFDLLVPDPRYFPVKGRDFCRIPDRILGQYDDQCIKKITHLEQHWEYGQRYECVEWKSQYAGIEKVFLIGKEKPNFKKMKKKKDFVMVLNEGGNGGLERGGMLETFVLSQPKTTDINIFGQWKTQKYVEDPRFKGAVPYDQLFDKISKYKYTFVIPIKLGYVTAKVWEMLYCGILPFFHPCYDDQKHVDAPEILRISKPEEISSRIKIIERSDTMRIDLLNELWDRNITKQHLNGKHWEKVLL